MKTITRKELIRLSFVNSQKLPRVINDRGVRKEWVGIGWLDCGKPTGFETKVVDK